MRNIERLLDNLDQASSFIPAELSAYYNWVYSAFEQLLVWVVQHLGYLKLQQDSILPDLFSSTQELTNRFRLYDQLLASPILRSKSTDRLCLKLLQWLHLTHPKTEKILVALSDREFASSPAPPLPTIYFMPSSTQHGLLYLPILFHEFGHLLYVCHKPEMDDLVEELQAKINHLLEPGSQRDDLFAQQEMKRRKDIVETWYEWTNELFCDAVGFTIGGPAFIYAFSMYFRTLGRRQYHLGTTELSFREHPVTWLRIRLLADRARQMDYGLIADKLEADWSAIAKTLKVIEDYYGFYEPEFLPAIQQTLNNMLVEADPRSFTPQEVNVPPLESSIYSPIALFNQAWHQFLMNPSEYSVWEKNTINSFLSSQ